MGACCGCAILLVSTVLAHTGPGLQQWSSLGFVCISAAAERLHIMEFQVYGGQHAPPLITQISACSFAVLPMTTHCCCSPALTAAAAFLTFFHLSTPTTMSDIDQQKNQVAQEVSATGYSDPS